MTSRKGRPHRPSGARRGTRTPASSKPRTGSSRKPARKPPGAGARTTRGASRATASRARLLLAGDIGGTKTNIALFEPRPRGVRLVEAARFASADHAGLGEIVDAFLSGRRAVLSAAAFGIAGPVVDRRSRTTNLPWIVDARPLSRRLNVPVVLVNDLATTAFSIPEIAPGNLATLHAGVPARDGNLALVAAGTGLGEAFVLREGGRFLVGVHGGGHADYAPRTDEEIEMLRFLRARFGRVSIERVLSGPGWLAANAEDAVVAKDFLAAAVARNGSVPHTIHADRGGSMTSRPVSEMMIDLGVRRSHSRPRCSNDNPYSEAQFKTLKYVPDFPDRFGSLADARVFCEAFFTAYNHEHRHSGIGMHTPASVHFDTAPEIRAQRQVTLDRAYAQHPERFNRRPRPPRLPEQAWINQPEPQPTQ